MAYQAAKGSAKSAQKIEFKPQPGPQTQFLASTADIVIYGGAAGGGKSYGLLLDALRHYQNPLFGGVIFRRTSVQVRNEGGLWDQSMTIYPHFKAKPREAFLDWKFPGGMTVGFAHIEHEKDVLNWQGAQVPWIGWDELTHFSEGMFFYMLSRNRSASGVKPRIRATCNPDPDSWVKTFISWWLDDEGAYPLPERSGKIRYFIRLNEQIHWADTAEELKHQFGQGPEIAPKSVTFISAKLEDNKILMHMDPQYLGNLLAMNRVDRLRLREGNWNVRAAAGMIFQRQWFPLVDQIPGGWIRVCRFWDRAATQPNEVNRDPDWTRGILLYKYPDGTYCVADLKSLRDTPFKVEMLVKQVAQHDGHSITIKTQQDPGSAGVAEAENFVKMLAGYDVRTEVMQKDKLTRAKPASAQCEWGNVKVLRAPWNDAFFSELENFPDSAHDDICDVFSGAFNELSGGLSTADVL